MKNIVSLFRAIVGRMPDDPAVIFEGQSYTYRELDLQSDRIATYLTNRKMKGQRIGTAMERSQEWIVALLGIWKAGATYVPLDLNHPRERLESIIADCGISFAMCSRGDCFKPISIPSGSVVEILHIEEELIGFSLPKEEDIAFIIYTSGTTGVPKGIPACHHQVVKMTRIAKDKFFYVNTGDKMLQLAGLNFSLSLVEVLTALLNGACLVIANEKERHDPNLLVDLIKREQICSAIVPPALLAVFPKVPLPELKTLLVGGERVATDIRDFWMKGRRMINLYGFTENTGPVASGEYKDGTPINDIGTLIPGSIAYILDKDLNPVPDGMPGEFCFAGPLLTEGYWNRPALNEEKFVQNPFVTDNEQKAKGHSRLYRSGDKMIRLANAHFLYLGRLDNQVKIRGMRIELSEIEQCLNRYPGVSMSVVLVKEHTGRKLIIAYLQSDKEISSEKITAFVAEKLPDYMRPAYYVTLLNFPMTINRKIDKSQLPDPKWDSKEYKEQPVTPTEKKIAQVWCKLLGLSAIGRYDNFIALGGDSISILLMTNALEEVFDIRMKAEDVFSHLDLHMLARFVEQSVLENAEKVGKIVHQSAYASCPLPRILKNLWSQCISSREMNEAYKVAFFLPWSQDLQVELLQKAWNKIVQEQEAMRMYFPLHAVGEPQIYISPFVCSDIPVCEVTTKDDFLKQAYELYIQPFRLEEGPLHRICLYRLLDGTYRLVIIMHHLVTDGWSVRVLNDKLHTYYQYALQGIHYPKEDYTYRDYAMWNREQLDKVTVEHKKSFWKHYLFNCPLPYFKGKRSDKISVKEQGSAKYIPMNKGLVEQLENYCSQYGVTPVVTCLSVFQFVLMKYTGQTGFAVGLAVTDRQRIEFQNLLGYFVSLLPVRMMDNQDKGFEAYSGELMKTVIKLIGNSLPYDLILDSLKEKVENQLIRFAFGLEESPAYIHIPEKWVTASSFDMALIIHKSEGDYSFHFQYSTACFDDEFIAQFAESFQVALQFLLNDPSRNMMECPLLPAERIAECTAPFNFSEKVFPLWNMMERFEEIVNECPDREAYCWKDFRMSYKELNETGNKWARAIQQKFVFMDKDPRKACIGVFLKNGKHLLPAIIGVLKNGACYVPLDTTLPIERLLFILGDAGISLLLVEESYMLGLPCETLSISPSIEKASSMPFCSVKSQLEDTAYIIYTSGSTGKPKGTPISHRSLVLFAESQAAIFHLLPDKRVLQYASIGFDASIMEIFPALITKASLVIPTEEERKESHLLLDLMEREKVYCALIPPALLSILPYRELPDLQTLVVGGESTPSDVIAKWMLGRRFVNAYGPTENTVVTTCLELSDNFLPNDIGTPLPGVSCYVLDADMTFLPDYVPGELYIGGLQLTTGYINRSELNREKFVDNPFVSLEDKKAGINTRLYKSGDKVMRTSRGHFIFLGRMDTQVKLRGFRIELEEIVKQLEEYPGVTQAIVLFQDFGNDKRIAAYLCTEATKEVKLDQVCKYLTDRLPFYMIPSLWALLERFPVTINGKVDRKALPKAELLITEDYEPPINREEEVLAEIVARLLQLPRVGVCTDLFALGLSSLQIMELIHDSMEELVFCSISDVYKGKNIRNILSSRERSLYFWGNELDSSKPLIVLVCGYPYFKPLYERFVERFKDDYSFFVFDSFFEYYRNNIQPDANELLSYYHQVLETELRGRQIYAVMGYCVGAELAMLMAEQLRTSSHPSIKVLIIDGFIRRDKTLLVPMKIDNELLREEGRIVNRIVETLPEPSFGGEIIICLAGKAPDRIMFETGAKYDELIRKMWVATQRNRDEWNSLYPQTACYILDADHFSILDNESVSVIYEIVKRNWNIH